MATMTITLIHFCRGFIIGGKEGHIIFFLRLLHPGPPSFVFEDMKTVLVMTGRGEELLG